MTLPYRPCLPKRDYGTKSNAQAVADARNEFVGDLRNPMSAYRCPDCNGWHIGHTPTRLLDVLGVKGKEKVA